MSGFNKLYAMCLLIRTNQHSETCKHVVVLVSILASITHNRKGYMGNRMGYMETNIVAVTAGQVVPVDTVLSDDQLQVAVLPGERGSLQGAVEDGARALGARTTTCQGGTYKL